MPHCTSFAERLHRSTGMSLRDAAALLHALSDDDLLADLLANVARPGRAPTDSAFEFYPHPCVDGGYWMQASIGELVASHWLPEPNDPETVTP